MSPARVRRTQTIRTRIVAAATALFIGLFGVIGVRLATGHDPALAQQSSANSTTSTTTSTSDDSELTTSDQPSQTVSPVTTSQS